MVPLELTEPMQLVRKMVHTYAHEEIRPIAAKYDELEEMPWPFLKRATETGVMPGLIRMELGGKAARGAGEELPNTNLMATVIVEELAWGCAGIAMALLSSSQAWNPVQALGNAEQQKFFLESLSGLDDRDRPKLAAMGLTEPEAGSDISRLQTVAVPDGDHYILKGSKRFLSNGASASIYLIWTTLDPQAGRSAVRGFIVPRETPGLFPGKKERKLGIRASETAGVTLEDCRVPAWLMLGYGSSRAPQGLAAAKSVLEITRPMVAALALGVGRAALEYATEYAKTHLRDGKLLAQHQSVAFPLAEVAAELTAARLLVWQAAVMADRMLHNIQEAAMAKFYAVQAAMRAASLAVGILGPAGLVRGCPVEKWFRDVRVFDILEGTGQILRRIVGKEMSGFNPE
jgi:acyl-CoA dehydrogenase